MKPLHISSKLGCDSMIPNTIICISLQLIDSGTRLLYYLVLSCDAQKLLRSVFYSRQKSKWKENLTFVVVVCVDVKSNDARHH